jgi:hypothetical protein
LIAHHTLRLPSCKPLNGAVASPAHEDIRIRHTQLIGCSLNMDEALENVTAITENGRIDLSSTLDQASDYNLSLVWYADDAGVLVIASAGATELDNANANMLQRLIIHRKIGNWEWEAKRDHN